MDVLGVRELQEIHGRLLPISQACCVRPLADPSSVLPFPLEYTIYTYKYTYMCVCVCVYIYIYIYIYIYSLCREARAILE